MRGLFDYAKRLVLTGSLSALILVGLAEFASISLAGGSSAVRLAPSAQDNIVRYEVDTAKVNPDWLAAIKTQKPVTVQDLRRSMADTTKISYSGRHGTQVEYASANGQVYLWYPGNLVILHGQWKADPWHWEYYDRDTLIRRFENSRFCFRYGNNTYNPATGHSGDKWECEVFGNPNQPIVETKRGDVFRLRGREAVPFVLPSSERISLEALRSRVRN